MNDLVASKAHNVFGGNHWAYIGFNDIATDKTYVFNSDNSPVLSAFSPTWYLSHIYGPGGRESTRDCGVLSIYKNHTSSTKLGYWAEVHCESGSRRSICE